MARGCPVAPRSPSFRRDFPHGVSHPFPPPGAVPVPVRHRRGRLPGSERAREEDGQAGGSGAAGERGGRGEAGRQLRLPRGGAGRGRAGRRRQGRGPRTVGQWPGESHLDAQRLGRPGRHLRLRVAAASIRPGAGGRVEPAGFARRLPPVFTASFYFTAAEKIFKTVLLQHLYSLGLLLKSHLSFSKKSLLCSLCVCERDREKMIARESKRSSETAFFFKKKNYFY